MLGQLHHLQRGLPVDLTNPVHRSHPFVARGMVLWWLAVPGRMGGDTFWDLLGLSHATSTFAPAGSGWGGTTRPGGMGQFSLDGTTSSSVATGLAAVPGIANLGVTFSAAVWARTGSTSSRDFMCFTDTGNVNGRVRLASSTQVTFVLNVAGNVTATTTFSAADSQWHQYLVTFSSGAMTLYIDGLQKATASTGGGAVSFDGTVGMLTTTTSTIATMSGQGDDLAVWNTALSAADAASWYRLGRKGYPGLLRRVPLYPYQANAGATLARRRVRKGLKGDPIFDRWRKGAP